MKPYHRPHRNMALVLLVVLLALSMSASAFAADIRRGLIAATTITPRTMLSENVAERTSDLDMTGSKPVFIRFFDNVFAVSVIRLSKYPRKKKNAQRPDTAYFYAKEIGVKSKQSNKTVYDYDSDSYGECE